MLALPSTPCGGISPMLIDFVVAEGIASAEATKGLSDRPLETFGSHPCYLIYIGSYSVSVLFVFLSNGFAQAA